MKTIPLVLKNCPSTRTLPKPRNAAAGVLLLAAFGLVCVGGASALAQTTTYCACSGSGITWNTPFWWIPTGGTPYSQESEETGACAFYHLASSMAQGEGWGVAHTAATVPGDGANVVYEVEVTQPNTPTVSTDVIFNVASTNCDIGAVYGATAAGGWTNTTALQAVHSVNMWGVVCWLTNRPGVVQPEIEFHYASGSSQRTYVDCIRFQQMIVSLPPCPALTNLGFAGGQCCLSGTGGLGKTFILLQTTNLATPVSSWTPVQTNAAGAGAFGFAIEPATAPPVFFRVQAR